VCFDSHTVRCEGSASRHLLGFAVDHDIDKAHPAGALRADALVIAQRWHVEPGISNRIEHAGIGGATDPDSVNTDIKRFRDRAFRLLLRDDHIGSEFRPLAELIVRFKYTATGVADTH
jgi:hypothetical protein